MDRRELMRVIAVATGITLAAVGVSEAKEKAGPSKADESPAAQKSNSQGFEKSGNPKAAGGPENPGRGNPHAYTG